jgi:mannose-1-phosphate guanylyltransferase/mannose-6-phosphate isomerase
VIFGVQPSFPSTAYGYIESEHELGEESAVPVKAFIEKPSLELATQLLANRNVFWNSGMVLAKAHVLLSELEVLAPDMLDHVTRAYQAGQVDGLFFRPDAEVFAQTPEDSFDYAVLEKK